MGVGEQEERHSRRMELQSKKLAISCVVYVYVCRFVVRARLFGVVLHVFLSPTVKPYAR